MLGARNLCLWLGETPPVSDQPAPVVFRPARLSILGALLLAVCATPVAFGAPYLWLLYLVPLGVIAWVLRVRTVADAEALTVRRVVGTRRVPWSEISSLRLHDRARVRAVLTDGAELPLPSVHIRDLPQLAAASGGRVAMGDD
jgi:Bacterial PH domain